MCSHGLCFATRARARFAIVNTAPSPLRAAASSLSPRRSSTFLTPSSIIRSSLPMAMNCQPSSMRALRFLGAEAVDAGGDAVLLAGRQNVLHRLGGRLAAGRLAVLAPHARGQVVGADEDGVDARHREDRVGVLDRLDVLALQDDRAVPRWRGRNNRSAVVPKLRAWTLPPTLRLPTGGYRHGGDGVLGLLPAVDHRHDDARGAVVEHALDVIVAIGRHARQGDAAGVGDGGEHVRRRLPVDQAVLDVHGQPGEAGAGQEARTP